MSARRSTATSDREQLMTPTYRNEDEIEKSIAKDFSRELAACDELRGAYMARCEPWTGRTADGPADRIILLEIGRSTKTYRGSVELARMGYGEQSAMLNRVLFESMAVARWINANKEIAVGRFPRALKFEDHLTAERLKNTGWLEPGEEMDIDLTDEELVALRRDFGKYNEQLWTGHDSIRDLLDDIKGQFSEEEWTTIQNYLRTGHQENNQLLHSTVGGLSQAYVGLQDGRYGIWTGPSDVMIGRTLFSAHMIYRQIVALVAERFELGDRDGLDELFERARIAFIRFTKDELKDVGRNDPCPCESGEKFKYCHGA